MANEKSLTESLSEIIELTKALNKAKENLINHPAFKQAEEMGSLLERFATGQPAMVAPKSPQTRNRRSAAQIAADNAAKEAATTTGK